MKKIQKTTVALSLIVTIVGYFAYNVRDAYFSVIPMIFLAVPAYYALLKVNLHKGLLFIIVLSIYATFIEALSILTGFPYGAFNYNSQLGYKLFNLVPWTVSFGWVPLVIGSFTMSSWIFKRSVYQFFGGISILFFSDLIIDPGAVLMLFWTWTEPGMYYSIPLTNYLGWIFSSTIGGLLLFWILPKNNLQKMPYYSSYTLALGNAFWIGVTFNATYWIPCLLGILLQLIIIAFLKK